MNITIASCFRNSSENISRYFDQISDLEEKFTEKDYTLNLVLGYGDSRDNTEDMLRNQCLNGRNIVLVECNHGGPEYGSVVHSDRFKQLAFVYNKIRSFVSEESDIVVWVESDLIWESSVLMSLISNNLFFPVISPLIFIREKIGAPFTRFYDTYAFIRNGINFENNPPYHKNLFGGILKMDSVGSCVVMQGSIFRQVSMPEEDVIVGMCRKITEMDYDIYCDTNLVIYHPTVP